MARYEDRVKAVSLRKQGLSYAAIKERLDVSKSTLSYWLRDLPLSREKINELRSLSPRRIERYRATMRKKREERLSAVYRQVEKTVKKLSDREILIAGLFLYWGEGGKTKPYTISLTNTDPDMVRFYMKWLRLLGVPKSKIKVRLHTYTDMNLVHIKQFWVDVTKIPLAQFHMPQIKQSNGEKIHYRGYGHGTCTIIVDDRDVSEYVLQGLVYLKKLQ